MIEQPELHLHPAAQADLADFFVESINAGQQFVIETHSEHLLLRIRRRVAEGTLSREKVSILYVEKRDGTSSVRQLPLNGRGHFQEWPRGFFDESYQEAMRIAEASTKAVKT